MSKPEDYNIYFEEDGSKKPNPYRDFDGFSKDGFEDESYFWGKRQGEIAYSLLTDTEKKAHDKGMRNLAAKMNS